MPVNILNRELKLGSETFIPNSFDETHFAMDWTMAGGGMVPTHFHRHMDEHFTVTTGPVTFTVNGEQIVKQTGETLLVPKMQPHSIKNSTKQPVALRVHYTPNADTQKMFQSWALFTDEGDGMLTGMLKWWYVQDKLGWKKFSEPADGMGRVMFGILGSIAMLAGRVRGWDKYLNRF